MGTLTSHVAEFTLAQNKKGTFKPVPYSIFNNVKSIVSGRALPEIRDVLSGRLTTGNFNYRPRVDHQIQLPMEDYQNGVYHTDDLWFSNLKLDVQRSNVLSPSFYTGFYSSGKNKFWLYGNGSTSLIMDAQTIPISVQPDPSVPFTVAIWTRDSYNSAVPYLEVYQVDSFTGELENLGREPTNSSYLNEFTYDEELRILETGRLIEKSKVVPAIGTATNLEILHFGETLGVGNGQGCQSFQTEFFPIDGKSVNLMTLQKSDDTRDGLNTWTLVASFKDSDPGDRHYTLDADLGIVRFAGSAPVETFTTKSAEIGDTNLRVDDISSFPWEGKILLSFEGVEEEYVYTGKHGTYLMGITPPLAEDWGEDTVVKTVSSGLAPEAGERIVLSYRAVPRVEFKPEKKGSEEIVSLVDQHDISEVTIGNPEDLRSNKRYEWKELATRYSNPPVHLLKNAEGIVAISRSLQVPAKITMKPVGMRAITRGNKAYWGPLYVDEDVAFVRGTVLDSRDVPIPDIEVEIFIAEGTGSIDHSQSITVITDTEGAFSFTYKPGREAFSKPLYARKADVLHLGGTTVMHFRGGGIPPVSDLNLLTLFAITKDDPAIGSYGYRCDLKTDFYRTVDEIGTAAGTPLRLAWPSYIASMKVADGVLVVGNHKLFEMAEIYKGGVVTVGTVPLAYDGTPQAITYKDYPIDRVVQIHLPFTNPDTTPGSRYEAQNTVVITTKEEIDGLLHRIVEVFVRTPEEPLFSPVKLNGRKSVLKVQAGELGSFNAPGFAYWDNEAWTPDDSHTDPHIWRHPIAEGISKVFKPVTPEAITGTSTLQFRGELPLPDEHNRNNMLAGYAVYAPREASVQARARIPGCSNQFLTSSPLRFFNVVSPRDSGTVSNDNYYVPYGFRLPSIDFDAASRLDGPIYLTINDITRYSASYPFRAPMVSILQPWDVEYQYALSDPKPNVVGYELIVEE